MTKIEKLKVDMHHIKEQENLIIAKLKWKKRALKEAIFVRQV